MFLATNGVDAVWTSVTSGLSTLLNFVPALIGALLILIIGWLIAGWLGRLVSGLLAKVGFDHAAERAGISGFLRQAGTQMNASQVTGELVKWFIRLIFLSAAASALQLNAVTNIINQIILFIPNLIVALVVVMVGFLLARFVAALVRGFVSESGFGDANLLANVTQYAIMALAVVVAIEQIGIAVTIINLLVSAIGLAVALAFGLSFGLGGRDVASQVWKSAAQSLSSANANRPAMGQPNRGPAMGTQGTPDSGIDG